MGKGGHPDTRKIAFLLLLPFAAVVIWAASAVAGEEGEVELFEKAYGYYLDNQPELAATAFGYFLEQFGKSSARDAALFWQAKSLALTGRTEEARKIFSAVGEEYRESVFGDFARKELEAPSPYATREGSASSRSKGETKKDSRDQGCEGLRSETDKLASEVKELSVRLRESEAKAAGLAAEKDKGAADIRKLQRERDEAVSALRDAELKLSEVSDAAVRLREREEFQREQDEYIGKLKEEVRTLAEGTKERDGKLSDAEKAIALMKEKLAAGGDAKKETEERRAERDNAELRELKKRSESSAREIEALTAKLQDKEKALAEKEDLVKKMSADDAAYEGKVKEAEAAVAELKKVREAYEIPKSELAGTAAAGKSSVGDLSAEKSERQCAEVKQAYELLAKSGRELEAEIAALEERIVRYETPVVKIGEKTYNRIEIAEHGRLAWEVRSKIGVSPSWTKGNAYEDFITERLLLRKVSDGNKSKAKDKAEKLAGKYSLDKDEKEYLTEYLAIEELIGNKKTGEVPDEDAMRRYYEAHRTEYVEKGEERTVKYLVVHYHKGEKLGTIALVSDLQREAARGKSFEDIARPRPGQVLLKWVKPDDLPEWIREKIEVLKDGEISNIFTEDQFIMLQMQVSSQDYRKYEDVREEIRKKLSRNAEGPLDLETWLAALRKEVVEIR